VKQWWAEAMLERCHRVPTEADWREDPIAARINPKLAAAFHDQILRMAADAASAAEKR